jgi:phosphosulfolactate phosphohydrolase-like enzyme
MTGRQRACGFADVGEFRDDRADRSDGVTALQSRSGSQQPTVLMEWGELGAAAICPAADYAVIVDILSFTTALSAIDAGAEVFPYRWRDESAPEFARRHDAVLAVGRSKAGGPGVVTLSPASISSAAGVNRIVLPSPNGSALASQLAGGDALVLGACLRNRMAIARWLADRAGADSTSGRELADLGFGHDVALAADLDASASVPVLAGDRFVDASHVPA